MSGQATVGSVSGFVEHILHVDMDAFFVEVERMDRPDLAGRQVIVGGLSPRGVVATASYEARVHGVGSAMPMAQARKLCPQGVFLAPDHARYRTVSAEVFDILRSVTPMVEGTSIDEAFIDVAGLRLHYADAPAVGAEIRRLIRSEVGLPASVGVATTKSFAKLASEEAKPDGLHVLKAETQLAFLHRLPVRKLFGVGEATLAALESLGVASVGDLASLPRTTLVKRLGTSVGTHLHKMAAGIDDRPVIPGGGGAKSISVEQTYATDLRGRPAIERQLLEQCDRLSGRLQRAGYDARTVGIKVRYADFSTVTRSHTVPDPRHGTSDLWKAVQIMLLRIDLSRPIRLLGVSASGLEAGSGPHQLSLGNESASAVGAAADEIRSRFGDGALIPGRLIGPDTSVEKKP